MISSCAQRMSDENKMKVALANKDGSVVFVLLERPSHIVRPSASFIAAYLTDLGYELNGFAVRDLAALDTKADYLVALGSDGLCASKPFARERLEDALYLAFVGLGECEKKNKGTISALYRKDFR